MSEEKNVKKITIGLCDAEELMAMNRKELMDKFAEILIEYYKDGEYSYEEYRSEGKSVPERNRQVKSRLRNQLMEMTKGNIMAPELVRAFIQYLHDIDDRLVINLKKQRRELKEKIKNITDKYEELQRFMDKQINERSNTMAQYRVDELYGDIKSDLNKARETNGNLRIIINQKDQELDYIRNNKSNEETQLRENILELELEIKELRAENIKLKTKKPVGRPPLDEKEKKRIKKQKMKEKYKKKLKALSDSEEESSPDSDSDSD